MKGKITKFLLYGLGLCGGLIMVNTAFISGLGNSVSVVEAENHGPTTVGAGTTASKKDGMEKFAEGLNIILKLLYTLLWPLLAIAGVSMDNGMVMGEFFHMDVALWQFWNIIKNFANFALGFIFIASILLYFFNIKQDKFNPKKVLPKLLIAGVAIQASWFIVAALLDLSTIATYGIGFLPLQVLEGTNADKPVLMWNGTFRMGNGGDAKTKMPEIEGTYGCGGEKKYLGCVVKYEGKEMLDKGAFDKLVTSYKGEGSVSPNFCVYRGKLIEINADVSASNPKSLEDSATVADATLRTNGCKTIAELTRMGKGITGPLFGLYGSILDVGSIALESSNKTVANVTLSFLIKAMIAIGLAIPLFALAVILIVRVVILWLVIGFSPLIALAEVFDFKLASDKGRLKEILGLVFLPVVAVFATSLSILFMSVISSFDVNKTANGEESKKIYDSFSIKASEMKDGKGRCFKIESIGVNLCFASESKVSTYSAFFDLFSYMLVNLCGIALMWAIIFAALKTSQITAGIAGGIQKFAQDILKAAPVVPMPGGAMSVGGLMQGAKYIGQAPQRMQTENFNQSLKPYLDHLESNFSKKKGEVKATASELSDGMIGSGTDAKEATEANYKDFFTNAGSVPNSSFMDYGEEGLGVINSLAKKEGRKNNNFGSVQTAFKDPEFQTWMNDNNINANNVRSTWDKRSAIGKEKAEEFDTFNWKSKVETDQKKLEDMYNITTSTKIKDAITGIGGVFKSNDDGKSYWIRHNEVTDKFEQIGAFTQETNAKTAFDAANKVYESLGSLESNQKVTNFEYIKKMHIYGNEKKGIWYYKKQYYCIVDGSYIGKGNNLPGAKAIIDKNQ